MFTCTHEWETLSDERASWSNGRDWVWSGCCTQCGTKKEIKAFLFCDYWENDMIDIIYTYPDGSTKYGSPEKGSDNSPDPTLGDSIEIAWEV